MTVEIGLVLGILAAALILLITEVIRMDLVALLVLATLALTGLVTPTDSLAGFSNPAVITIWAMFILSAGLTRTGVAEVLGSTILRWVGRGEVRMIVVIMLTSGVLSAFMNNIGVAALMLPVVITVGRQTNTSPSRLLMPLAFGSLLGGLTTLIGTPPNLLVSEALREHGLKPFSMFDYTPVGGVVMVVGVAAVALVGRFLLPKRDPGLEASSGGASDLAREYRLDERAAVVRLPVGSPLDGRTLGDSRFGSATQLNVYAIQRSGKLLPAPGPATVLRERDGLLVEGLLDRFEELRSWRRIVVSEDDASVDSVVSADVSLSELQVAPGADVVGQTLQQIDFRVRFGAIVLAIRRDTSLTHRDLTSSPLQVGDRLLIQGHRDAVRRLTESSDFEAMPEVTDEVLAESYDLQSRIFSASIPADSSLVGRGIVESRIGSALGVGVLGLRRGEATHLLPGTDERLEAGDVLFVRGTREDLEIFRGLQGLRIESETPTQLQALESEDSGLTEVVLSPRTSLASKSPAELQFRARYGLRILAVLRRGEIRRSGLQDLELQFGDALLLLGPREKLRLLARDPDFLVMTGEIAPAAERRKAPVAVLIMAAVVTPAIFGWVPIAISAVAGAAVMILVGCIAMDEAYRAIEWRAVFLIAGMLPLGTALQETGAASLVAEGVVNAVGPMGPWAVVAALYLVTAAATSIIPTAALVVLMAPIALTTCESTGLSPYAVMMAIAMAASASFTSPVSHPANVLVMGPGGYRFVDYVKLGVPLTLLVMAVVLIVLPLFWPL
ncbi:MAG: SLC13 family permease [Acidobacteriota bacterium]|nr:SLC13 family permease [Acidobacteriota bacterium]